MQAVEGFSHGYVEGNAWRTPLSWTAKTGQVGRGGVSLHHSLH